MKERNCKPATADYYPEKISVDYFAKEIKNTIDNFAQNMKNLKGVKEHKWAEDWMEMFQAWSEMEKGDG